MECECIVEQYFGEGCAVRNPHPTSEAAASEWMGNYFPGPNCRRDRCEHYRMCDSESGPWCWLLHGIGAEGLEPKCPSYQRAMKAQPLM